MRYNGETMVKEKIKQVLEKITGEKEICVDASARQEFGDYTTSMALQMKGDPMENARILVEKLDKDRETSGLVEKIEVAGPGFINFWLKKKVLDDILTDILLQKDAFGRSQVGNGKTVVVDYSSPNIAKRFSIGHLRSTIIGQSLYNVYKELGYKVIGDNHLGDWGTQFGKLLYMINLYKLKEFDVDKLEELYVEFHQKAESNSTIEEKAREWFKKLEDGNPEAKSIWQKCVDVSMKEFERVYDLLKVKIDFTYGESFYEDEMKMMVEGLMKGKLKGLEEGDDGAKIINLNEYGIRIPLMYLKRDGATTYATRDLACVRFRVAKWNPDIIIYEVGEEQALYFQQVFAASRKLGLVRKEVVLYHTKHGLYLSPDGKKFRTREGGTIKLEEVLKEAIERAEKLGCDNKNTAEKVGLGAIKYFDLMHAVTSNIVFDWEKVMNLEGNSGPYIQYTVARTNSVLEKSPHKILTIDEKHDLNQDELSLLRHLAHYQEMIEESANSYSPNILCNYLYNLAQKYNSFYNQHRIIGSENESYRLILTLASGQILKNGLRLLGIDTPERM